MKLRNILKRRKIQFKKKSFKFQLDGALFTKKRNTYGRLLATKKIKGIKFSGKGSYGSRGTETGAYLITNSFFGGISISPKTKEIRPSLRVKKKKVL